MAMLENTDLWKPVTEGFTPAGAIIFWCIFQAVLLYLGFVVFKPRKND